MEFYDRPGARLRLKVRMLIADVIEKPHCWCVAWSPNKLDGDRPPQARHSMLLRYLGWRKRKLDDHNFSYANALAKTDSESIDTLNFASWVTCILLVAGVLLK